MSFEGAEKLLEIWFTPGTGCGLRNYTRSEWADMLSLVKCEILNHIATPELDSYLLSESSLFVYPHKIILKTCGTTTLLRCLPRLIEMAANEEKTGVSGEVDFVFYSRKSFMFPDRQVFPHTDWKDEVKVLESIFYGGAAYSVGKTNGDSWYCYVWEDRSHRVEPVPDDGLDHSVGDHTLEILMTDLCQEAAQTFYKSDAFDKNGKVKFTERLHEEFPNTLIDDFQFDPCGYSCNGLTAGGGYFTIHVTPEPSCSYASFETNVPPSRASYQQVIDRVVRLFNPGRFTVTLFSEKAWIEEQESRRDIATQWVGLAIDGYARHDKILYEFENYDLLYYHYERADKKQQRGMRPIQEISSKNIFSNQEER